MTKRISFDCEINCSVKKENLQTMTSNIFEILHTDVIKFIVGGFLNVFDYTS